MKRRNEKLSGSLTLRLSSALQGRLAAEASRRDMTPSEVVRLTLAEALLLAEDQVQTLGEKTAPWLGALSSTRIGRGRDARRDLASWKPDRRE